MCLELGTIGLISLNHFDKEMNLKTSTSAQLRSISLKNHLIHNKNDQTKV